MPDNQRIENVMLIHFFNIILFYPRSFFAPLQLASFKPILIMQSRAVKVRPEPHFQPPDDRKTSTRPGSCPQKPDESAGRTSVKCEWRLRTGGRSSAQEACTYARNFKRHIFSLLLQLQCIGTLLISEVRSG